MSTLLPPLDDLPDPAFDELEFVPDATARLRFELTGTPVGNMRCDIRYQDGRRPLGRVVTDWPDTTAGEPAHEAPLIHVGVSFANYLQMRTGEKSYLEAIADGGTVGDTRWTLLLLLHGIVQQQRYTDAYRALTVFPEELGWWAKPLRSWHPTSFPAEAPRSHGSSSVPRCLRANLTGRSS